MSPRAQYVKPPYSKYYSPSKFPQIAKDQETRFYRTIPGYYRTFAQAVLRRYVWYLRANPQAADFPAPLLAEFVAAIREAISKAQPNEEFPAPQEEKPSP